METLSIPAFKHLETLHCDFRAEIVVAEVSEDYWTLSWGTQVPHAPSLSLPDVSHEGDDTLGMEISEECDCIDHYYLRLLPEPPTLSFSSLPPVSLADRYTARLREIMRGTQVPRYPLLGGSIP